MNTPFSPALFPGLNPNSECQAVQCCVYIYVLDGRLLFPVDEVCRMCSFGSSTFYEERRDGKLFTCKVRGKTMVKAKDLAAYIDALV